jgi:alpha-N-arabinofuranosidase
MLGRETFLAPVRWDKNAWPVVNGNGTIDLNMDVPALPLQPFPQVSYNTEFDEDKLGFEWNYLRNPRTENYSLIVRKGYLRLEATPISLDDIDSPTFVGRRQEHVDFTATVTMNLFDAREGDESGMTVFMNNKSHYDLFVKQATGGKRVLVIRYRLGVLSHTACEVDLPKGDVYLQVHGHKDYYSFAYSTDGKNFETLDKVDVCYISSETAGGFTGIYLGLFATSATESSKAYADFDNFVYAPKVAD